MMFLIAFAATGTARAQNDALLTQQWLSRINQNPAATGNSEYLDVYLLMRQQWAGFENAPETQVLNIHNYFRRIQSGVGLTGMHDRLGVGYDAVNVKLAYAFHVNLGSKWLLSLGLSGGVMQTRYDPDKHFTIDREDDDFFNDRTSQLNPDVDFGIELNSQRFRFGASATHLMRTAAKQTTLKVGQQYHAYLSYRHPLGESFDLIGGVRGTNFDGKPYYDVNLTGMLLKKYWLGAAFRPGNAVAGMLGVQIAFLRLGYSYDYSLGDVRNIATGSHEIMVSFRISKPAKEINTKSPRFIEE
jgi:type IX secretion system PorP/SprF family membrane protein